MRLFFYLLWTVLLVACEPSAERSSKALPLKPAAPARASTTAAIDSVPLTAGDPGRGEKLVEQFECNRCHQGTGLQAPKLERDCVRCHSEILSGKFKADRATLARFRPHVESVGHVPSLTKVGQRLRGDWLRSFLLKPHDLRPALAPTMPRLPLTPEAANDIAAYLTRGVPAETVAAQRGSAESGRALFETRGCATCHSFGGAQNVVQSPKSESVQPLSAGVKLAPDLRHTRLRFRRDALVSWLMNPQNLKPDTLMPNLGLSEADASDLAAFILTVELVPEMKPKAYGRLPLLTRNVSFDEVNEKVFSRTCQHCHGDPDVTLGDGGPGNSGGFGFRPRGVSFVSHQSIMAGRIDDSSTRRSVFEPLADGTPLLVAVLERRHSEQAGVDDAKLRGMPLGMPALAAEDIQLVASWIAQGRRR